MDLSNRGDEEIVGLVQEGDKQAFRVLMERYEPRMTRYVRRFLFGADESKDIVQEIFIKAYVNVRSFDTSRRFSPWLYRIAHNESLNALKKKKKERENLSLFDLDFDVFLPGLVARETADEEINREEAKRLLDASMGALPLKYREPLLLYYFEDMDYRSISDVLRIPVSTVGVRLKRGKALLKNHYGELGR